MKILHLLSTNSFSGAEHVACLIMAMMKDRADVLYCSPDGSIRDAVSDRGLFFLPIGAITPREVRRVLREHKPDIIHAHDRRASIVAALVCGKIKLISHIHSNAPDFRRFSLISAGYLIAAVRAKQILWVSESSREQYWFERFFRKKSTVLYNIIDMEEISHLVQGKEKTPAYDIVYVGRLTAQKDPMRLLSVIACVVEYRSNLRVALIGDGDMLRQVQEEMAKRDLSEHIDLLGFTKKPLNYVQNASVMLMTSRFEGTPMSALEALAVGTPVFSTPTDGLCELIRSGENGFLSDDDDCLAKQITQTLDFPEQRRCLSEGALRFSIGYNDKTAYRKTLCRIYDRMIGE